MATIIAVLAVAAVAVAGSVVGIRVVLALLARRVRSRGLVPMLVRARSGADGLPRDWRRIGGLRLTSGGAMVTWEGRDYRPLQCPGQLLLDPDCGLASGGGPASCAVSTGWVVPSRSVYPGPEVPLLEAHMPKG